MADWQPIETARPADGESVILYIPIIETVAYGHFVGPNLLYMDGERCSDGFARNVTHWMPLPEPPA